MQTTPMQSVRCNVLIIGAGPGGYACGIRAGQLGLDTIVVEAEKPGGTCLNVGCIPSKALIHAADAFAKVKGFQGGNALGITAAAPKIDLAQTIAWKDGIVERLTGGVSGLLKAAKARYVTGHAQLVDGKTVDVDTQDGPMRIACDHLVIATGSKPQDLPGLPFGGKVISSTQALELDAVPSALSVVGGGYIGLEIGTALAKLGSQVTIIEASDRILPQYDAQLTQPVLTRLKALGIKVHLSTKAQGLSEDYSALTVDTGAETLSIPSDKVLVTIGRVPVTGGFGLEELGLSMKGRFIAVDDHCATSMRGVFAIGDVTGDPMLAHRAMAQGTMVAEHIAGRASIWDKRAMPAVCFTDPEIVTVGALPGEVDGARAQVFPFAANGRAMTMERSDGFLRLVYMPATELVLGVQAVGPGVSELAGQFALAIEMGATLTDLAETVHAHPTLGESIPEAALKSLGRALHI